MRPLVRPVTLFVDGNISEDISHKIAPNYTGSYGMRFEERKGKGKERRGEERKGELFVSRCEWMGEAVCGGLAWRCGGKKCIATPFQSHKHPLSLLSPSSLPPLSFFYLTYPTIRTPGAGCGFHR